MINFKMYPTLLMWICLLGISIGLIQGQSNGELPLTISDLEYSPNVDIIARIYRDARLVVSETSNGNIMFEGWMPIESAYTAARVAWSPISGNLAVGAGSQVHILSAGDFHILHSLQVGLEQGVVNTEFGEVPEGVISLGWNTNGVLLMVKSLSGRYTVWDTNNTVLVADYSVAPVSSVNPVVWLGDNRHISTGFSVFDIYTQQFSPRLGSRIPEVVGQCSIETSIATSASRTQIVQGTANGCVVVIDGESGDQTAFYRVNDTNNPVWGVSWSPDGSRIAAVDSIGYLYIIDTTTGTITATRVSESLLNSVDWSPDSHEIAFGGHSPDGIAEAYGIKRFPVAIAIADQNFVEVSGFATIILDGSTSIDSDGTIVSYIWTLDGTEIATGVAPTVNLPVGTHVITLTVTDDGLTASDTVTIESVKNVV